jgi:predicted DNA-binding protein
MYAHPSHLHDREIKLRLDEDTYLAVEALAKFHKTQKAVFVRDLVEAALERAVAEDTHNQQVA